MKKQLLIINIIFAAATCALSGTAHSLSTGVATTMEKHGESKNLKQACIDANYVQNKSHFYLQELKSIDPAEAGPDYTWFMERTSLNETLNGERLEDRVDELSKLYDPSRQIVFRWTQKPVRIGNSTFIRVDRTSDKPFNPSSTYHLIPTYYASISYPGLPLKGKASSNGDKLNVKKLYKDFKGNDYTYVLKKFTSEGPDSETGNDGKLHDMDTDFISLPMLQAHEFVLYEEIKDKEAIDN